LSGVRNRGNDQNAEVILLVVERDATLEAQRQGCETKREAKREEIETQRKDLEAKLEA